MPGSGVGDGEGDGVGVGVGLGAWVGVSTGVEVGRTGELHAVSATVRSTNDLRSDLRGTRPLW
ncbi:MAG: hypothetical protein E6J47_06445 [Chloroflexi bacterium]|nr:MAG: hypothetical protein E6J47_06445 [Chloroflexota bacterium]